MLTDVPPPQHDGGDGGAVQRTWMPELDNHELPFQYDQLGAFSGHIWVVVLLVMLLALLQYEVPRYHSFKDP